MASGWNRIESPPKRRLEELYVQQEFSAGAIAKLFGVSRQVVLRWLREYGIVARDKYQQRGIDAERIQGRVRDEEREITEMLVGKL